jgi:FtsP/CotA-like multicopper oxidase with cupredoxin domain
MQIITSSGQIIEVDGVNHVPLEVDQLQIFAAQRYSIVMKADQPINNYCMVKICVTLSRY